jgi:hypothetical protein
MLVKYLLWNRIGALVLGAAWIVAGLLIPGEHKCGDRDMKPGDVCTDISSGIAVDRSYDEMAKRGTFNYVALGIGGVMILGGVIANVRYYARKRQQPTATPTAQ